MAKATGKGKTRAPIKVQHMRELMFASGGWCAMTDCGLSLTSPTGGWIGTVAHIVAAEEDGARGDSPLTSIQRAEPRNLLLMCATHGREVDAPDTGEANFPVEQLKVMKETHETKVMSAVAAAIAQDKSGVPTATGTIDVSLRDSTAALTAEGLLESLLLHDADDDTKEQFVAALDEARATLRQLSQLALEILSLVLTLWTMKCRTRSGTPDFGDWSVIGPTIPIQDVLNRVTSRSTFDRGYAELHDAEILDCWDDDAGSVEYSFERLWETPGQYRYNFWISIATFLYEGYGVAVGDWVRGLDFSILDRVAPETRNPTWRE